MKTTSLEILKESALPAAQARAMLKVMESEMTSAQEMLATKNDILALGVKMKGIEGALTRWVFTCILGQTAVLAGLGYFFVTHWGR
jgi:hypothetical protein